MKKIKLTKELAKTLIENHDPIITENYSIDTWIGELLIRKFHYDKIADEYFKNEKNVLHYLTEESELISESRMIHILLCDIVFKVKTLEEREELMNQIRLIIKNYCKIYLAFEDLDTVESYFNGYLDEDNSIYIIEP